MPRIIECDSEEAWELGDVVEQLESNPPVPGDEESLAAHAEALKKLGNNRRFLGDIMIKEMKAHCDGQRLNQYSAQVMVLYNSPRCGMIRANFWPAEGDSIFHHSGPSSFYYGIPHDHNFNFLTVGYIGPGYESDYYEYEYEDVVGYSGEKVPLRFVERSQLDQGKLMLYRAHKDVHLQFPAREMSISLNILELATSEIYRDQYVFDIENSAVDHIINNTSVDPMVGIVAHLGGAEGRDLVTGFAAAHPSDRIRFVAVRALASLEPDLDARIRVYEEAARNGSRFVREMAAREARRIEKNRDWLYGPKEPVRSAA
ncbi:MAG: transposase [Sphingomonadaceae bacterium]